MYFVIELGLRAGGRREFAAPEGEEGKMERGSGKGARKWAVELHDTANTSSSRDLPPDPLGFSRSTVDPVCRYVILDCALVRVRSSSTFR